AKGLEFDTVFIVGLEEGLFPLQRTITEPLELEEERRLFYVGATRAEKLLYLSAASKRYRGGEILSRPSRFLKEIPEHLLDLTDLRPAGFGQGVSDRPSRFARSDYEPTSSPKGVHYEFDESDGLAPGRIVQHPTFGRGRIVHTEGYGDSLTLEIQFAGVGAKKIMPRFVRLRVIG
ncbi:MAG TPA: 3'-5' exonuclease, partial [Candidatus Deferrimicrobium sp.]|nr:3'-5' exonuclease [Candidatus Deferrimicrobium sp.]